MSLLNLADDVLTSTCQYAVGVPPATNNAVKNQLPLLSTCQKLRQVAEPVVYKKAYFNYAGAMQAGEDMDPKATLDHLSTNIDLLEETKMLDMVTAVHISVSVKTHPISALELIRDRIREAVKSWESVTELSLLITYQQEPYLTAHHSLKVRPIGSQRTLNRYVSPFKPLVAGFNELLPNITRMQVQGSSQCMYEDEWYHDLAGSYAAQLQHLSRPLLIHADECKPLTALTSLSLGFQEYAHYQLVHAAAPTLQKLELRNIACTVMDSLPGSAYTFKKLGFPELRSLLLEYPRAPNVFEVDMFTDLPDILMPQLQTLRILYGGNYCPVLAHAKLPRHIQKVEVIGQFGVLEQLSKSRIKLIDELRTTAMLRPNDNLPKSRRLLQTLYDPSRVTQHGGLRLDSTLALGAADLHGLMLTHVQVGMELTPSMLVVFLDTLKALVHVNFTNVRSEESEVESLPSDDPTNIEPLEAPLRAMTIRYNSVGDVPSAKLLNYLVLRLPRLQSVSTNKVSSEPVKKHVELLASKFPHLRDICFNLADGSNFIFKKSATS
ncbi:hypothetical protein LPJ70_001024 [Coemansia sp. RSA 2708]|nr:hypothetical protein LPJ70_001024 [Coemansia sp. RSA 2708]KAJ2307310.1 hypothetical protein IWW54_004427 [Coemansia sp. RSA 2705]